MIATAPLLPKLRQSQEQLGKSNESLSKRQSIATQTNLILNLGHNADKLPPAPNKPFYIQKLPTTLRHKAPCLPRIDSSVHPSNRDPVHDATAPMQILDKDMLLGTKWLLQNLHSGKITSLPKIYDYPACMSVYKPGLRGWATGYIDFRGDDPHHSHSARDFGPAVEKAPELRLHAGGKTAARSVHDSVSNAYSNNQTRKGTNHGLAKVRHEILSTQIHVRQSYLISVGGEAKPLHRTFPTPPSQTCRSKRRETQIPLHVFSCAPSDSVSHPPISDAFLSKKRLLLKGSNK
ncbi:hypothetical protein HDU77_008475 [Chytriomyces hyalinus]|nr:hypothetical protein HDU77_008475 [Chytriomyces hyalinus]